jgi:hypothetical protein
MTYCITGLAPEPFAPLFAMDDAALAAHRARAVVADAAGKFPCRVSLEEARPGERLVLVNHAHHEADTPYRASHAIYVREGAREAAVYRGRTPPVFEGRVLSLRGYDGEGMMRDARLAQPGEADETIRALLADPGIAYVDAHNAVRGCFAARIERDGQ